MCLNVTGLQEHQEQVHDLVIEETELKQVVYVFSCNNSTLQIKGKVNSIIVGESRSFTFLHSSISLNVDVYTFPFISICVDNCKKLGLVFENVVGIFEIINSRDIRLQVSF